MFVSFRVFLRFSQHLLQVEYSIYCELFPREWQKSALFFVHEHLVHIFLSKFRSKDIYYLNYYINKKKNYSFEVLKARITIQIQIETILKKKKKKKKE